MKATKFTTRDKQTKYFYWLEIVLYNILIGLAFIYLFQMIDQSSSYVYQYMNQEINYNKHN
jgi:hypothetical protein